MYVLFYIRAEFFSSGIIEILVWAAFLVALSCVL